MLKLSNRGLYGIKALYELANNYGKEPLAIRENIEASRNAGAVFSNRCFTA